MTSRVRPQVSSSSIAVASLVLTAVASAAPPVAIVSYSVDNGPVQTVEIPGVTAQNGNQSYSGIYTGPGNAWQVFIALSADFNVNPQAQLTGLLKFTNSSPVTRAFAISADVALCPAIVGGSLLGGTTTLTLSTTGPGSLTCANSVPIVQAIADGNQVGNLFYCPFNMQTTGSGTLTSNALFGLPGPSLAGPAAIGTIGARFQGTITANDNTTAQIAFMFKDADASAISGCGADLNGDGIVGGADLSYLFFHWEETSDCPGSVIGDINADGIVDSDDLLFTLSSWGPCPTL
jgi:hypothetical protein